MPHLAAFAARYPDVIVERLVSDRFVEMVEEEIDVAIRIGEVADSALLTRRIGTTQRVTVASPAYLDRVGAPAGPHDLDRHACIVLFFHRAVRP